jgi:hypothetical protein
MVDPFAPAWSFGKLELTNPNDFDFCEKVKKAGFHVIVDTTVRVKHDFSGTVKEDGSIGYHSW